MNDKFYFMLLTKIGRMLDDMIAHIYKDILQAFFR